MPIADARDAIRITIGLRDDLLKRAKKHATEERRTLTSLVEEGFALVLARPTRERRDRVELPLSTASGGTLPGVDLDRSTRLESLIEDP